MRTRLGLALVVGTVTSLGAIPADARSCSVVSDAAYDQSGVVSDEPRLDLLQWQLDADAAAVTVRIRVRELDGQLPSESTGAIYRIAFSTAGAEVELTAHADVAGKSFVAHVYGGETGSVRGLPGGDVPIQGGFDEKSNEVTLRATRRDLAVLGDIQPSSRLDSVIVSAGRWTGTALSGGVHRTADLSETSRYLVKDC